MRSTYSAYQILDKKRKAIPLTAEEITWFINQYLKEAIPDYQMSALLMAIAINGASEQETAALTDVMLYSGETYQFSEKNIIDKHSTGGVGDKTSFILAPLAAACDVKIPMIAGRGLGFTGGTVDKIEAVSGFKTSLSIDEFKNLLLNEGLVLMGQTSEIAPADKRIYALRDVTATIESIPLITASIMSKKLAEGANGIVMDIKLGSGAFMREREQARQLADSIIATAHRFDRKACALISNMDQPLGNKVGHSLEIIESIETLKGRGPEDLTELSVQLAAYMVLLAGQAEHIEHAIEQVQNVLINGQALEKFKSLLKNQGGETKIIDDYSLLPTTQAQTPVLAARTGFLKLSRCADFGHQLIKLGGGRQKKTDQIDFAVGFDFHHKTADKVNQGQPLLTIHHQPEQKQIADEIAEYFVKNCLIIQDAPLEKPPVIYEIRGDQQ